MVPVAVPAPARLVTPATTVNASRVCPPTAAPKVLHVMLAAVAVFGTRLLTACEPTIWPVFRSRR